MRITAEQFHDLVTGRARGFWPSCLRHLCSIAEVPYRVAIAARNAYYDRSPSATTQVDIPVVSVGNLTVGGTGKTPMVAWLAKWFRQRGVRVAILSRGYGAEAGAINDEALELEERLPDVPHLQNPNRVESARIAIEELDSQLLIMDDGFQHRRLHRDLDIVLVDASQPMAFDRLLPRGFYREPISSLRRADAVVITRADMASPEQLMWLSDFVRSAHSELLVVEATHEPTDLISASGDTCELAHLRETNVLGFCGIGQPGAFWHTLGLTNCHLRDQRAFPDHHAYTAADVNSLAEWVSSFSDVAAIVCTHKDLVKIGVDQLAGTPLYALRVQMGIRKTERLESLLATCLQQNNS